MLREQHVSLTCIEKVLVEQRGVYFVNLFDQRGGEDEESEELLRLVKLIPGSKHFAFRVLHKDLARNTLLFIFSHEKLKSLLGNV